MKRIAKRIKYLYTKYELYFLLATIVSCVVIYLVLQVAALNLFDRLDRTQEAMKLAGDLLEYQRTEIDPYEIREWRWTIPGVDTGPGLAVYATIPPSDALTSLNVWLSYQDDIEDDWEILWVRGGQLQEDGRVSQDELTAPGVRPRQCRWDRLYATLPERDSQEVYTVQVLLRWRQAAARTHPEDLIEKFKKDPRGVIAIQWLHP